MNMKKFVKKPLAIAVLMLTFGGVANIAHARTIKSQDVSATKEVKRGGILKVEFTASPDEIVAGKQAADVAAFILKVSDTGDHTGWKLVPTGSSKGGYMYDDSGNKVPLHASGWSWVASDELWSKKDNGHTQLEEHLYLAKGEEVKAGQYHFTGRVEEYL